MTFSQSVTTCLKHKYFEFEGRASRSEYWWFFLFQVIIGFAFCLLEMVFGIVFGNSFAVTALSYALQFIVSLAFLIPSLAVGARRLHDGGHSAWHLLWFSLPLVGYIILLVFFVMPGSPLPNKYGEAVDD